MSGLAEVLLSESAGIVDRLESGGRLALECKTAHHERLRSAVNNFTQTIFVDRLVVEAANHHKRLAQIEHDLVIEFVFATLALVDSEPAHQLPDGKLGEETGGRPHRDAGATGGNLGHIIAAKRSLPAFGLRTFAGIDRVHAPIVHAHARLDHHFSALLEPDALAPDFLARRHSVGEQEHDIAEFLRAVHFLVVTDDLRAGLMPHQFRQRLDFELADVTVSERLIGDVMGFDAVEIPDVDDFNAELRQAEHHLGPGRACADHVDPATAEGERVEFSLMSIGINHGMSV